MVTPSVVIHTYSCCYYTSMWCKSGRGQPVYQQNQALEMFCYLTLAHHGTVYIS